MHQSVTPPGRETAALIRSAGTARMTVPMGSGPHHAMLRALAGGYADALDLPGPYVLTGRPALPLWCRSFDPDQVITTTEQAPAHRAVIVLDLDALALRDPAPIVDLARRHWALVFETSAA